LDGTSVIWIDGNRQLTGRIPQQWPSGGGSFNVGSNLGGQERFHGRLQDLCAFDRVLTDQEVQELHAGGLRQRPPRNTEARLRATVRDTPIVVSTNVTTAVRSWTHHRFTTEDGLPSNIVKAVLEARDGYLWVGAENGLARFDGREFQQFTAENTPALRQIGQTVWSLSEDNEGTIWAGTFGGLLRIRSQEFTAFTNGLPQRFILHAVPTGDGSLWIAGFNAFLPRGALWLRRYDPSTQTSSAEVVVPGHVRRLVPAKDGVWMAAEQPAQMLFWDGRSKEPIVLGVVGNAPGEFRIAQHRRVPDETTIQTWKQSSNNTNTWAEVRFGRDGPAFGWLWDSRLSRPFAARWTGSFVDGSWFGVSYDLARLRENSLESIQVVDQASRSEIVAMCPSRKGGVWFGTEEDGLHFLNENLIRVFTSDDGLVGNDVRSVCARGNQLWVGGADGANLFTNGSWLPLKRFKVRTVGVDGPGGVWMGIGIASDTAILKGGQDFLRLGIDWQDPNTIRFASDGTLWVVCERGLTWIKPSGLTQNERGEWVPRPEIAKSVFGRLAVGSELPGMVPVGLVEDVDGTFWLGSLDNGLFHISDGHVEACAPRDLPNKRCMPVYRDNSGAIWIVGDRALIRRAAGRFQTIDDSSGLPRDTFLDLIEDDLGYFWISGKRGIHRVARRQLEDWFGGKENRIQSLTLGLRDGLLTPECSSLHYPTMAKTADGHIWVATRNGLASFDPKRVQLDTQPPPAVLERFMVNHTETEIGASAFKASSTPMRLPPGSGDRIQIHFGAVSLLNADKVRFRYRLDGYDSEWSAPTDLRLAFYTNLRPGAYRFRVKAANEHGVWNDRETALSFFILPHFWQTWWFFSLVAAVGVCLAAAFHWHRLRVQRVTQQLRHEQQLIHEKSRIAADMHDELGATLTQIAILGEISKTQTDSPSQTRSNLERISDAAREVISGMSELVWATNPRNDTLENLVAYLREQAASQLSDCGVKANIDFPVEVPHLHVSATLRRNLLLVVRELLHNVVKHSNATQANITLRTTNDTLFLSLKDNGKGFDIASCGRGNGIFNMQKRIADLEGQLLIRSEIGQGVTAEIKLPLLAALSAKVSI
jgi:signal transduction histidine kinase/ligand-binding sensor domain-containing protein